MESESFFRPAAVKPPPLEADLVDLLLLLLLEEDDEELPRTPAQRARAAAANFARVAADIGRRRRRPSPEDFLALLLPPLSRLLPRLPAPLLLLRLPPLPPNNVLKRDSSECICSRSDKASFRFSSE